MKFYCTVAIIFGFYVTGWSQITDCFTEVGSEPIGAVESRIEGGEHCAYYIRLKFHVIQREDPANLGGVSVAEVQASYNLIADTYNQFDIYFLHTEPINYIQDDGLYSDYHAVQDAGDEGGSFHSLSDDYPDFLNIFIVPDTWPEVQPYPGLVTVAGAGNAFEGVPGTGIWVGGTRQGQAASRSSILLHELGHCLGLYHPFQGSNGDDTFGCEPAEGSPFSGDFVEDTPADHRCWRYSDLPGDCDPIFNCEDSDDPFDQCSTNSECFDQTSDCPPRYDASGTPYTPPVANYMRPNSKFSCLTEFTPGQVARMKTFLEIDENLQSTFASAVGNMLEITNSLILPENDELVVDDIIVKDGASFNIPSSATVRFSNNASLIIEPGGVVQLYSKLVGLCGSTWKGVQVIGNSTASQYPTNGSYEQGRIIAHPGSVIENAETAIRLYGFDADTQSGGMAFCRGLTLRNNVIGVDIKSYEGFVPPGWPANSSVDYGASFTECTFVNDAEYPHNQNFRYFARLVEVDGVLFRSCDFENDPGFQPTVAQIAKDSYGYGIFAIDAGVRVQGACNTLDVPCEDFTYSEFSNLSYGIHTGYIESIDAPLVVTRTDFRNCYIGVQNYAVTGMSVSNCRFTLNTVPDSDAMSDPMGIHLYGSMSGFTIEENSFTQESPLGKGPKLTTGISCHNVGSSNKQIYTNSFDGVNIANRASGVCGDINQGLYYECNENRANLRYDFFVCDHERTAQDRIAPNQQGAQGLSAQNTFSNTGIYSDRDFANQGEYELRYFHPDNGGSATVPDEFSGISEFLEVEPNTCPTDYCPPPCLPPGELQQLKTEYHNAQQSYLNSSTTGSGPTAQTIATAQYKRVADRTGYRIFEHYTSDSSQVAQDSIATWFQRFDNYGAQMKYVNSTYYEGQAAVTTDNEVQTEDYQQELVLNNLLATYEPEQLAENQLIDLYDIATADHLLASSRAANILLLRNRPFFPSLCRDRVETVEPRSNGTDQNHQSTVGILEIELFPNPTTNHLTIEFSRPVSGTIRVMDMMGKENTRIQISSNEQLRLDTSALPSGVYTLIVNAADDNAPSVTRFIVQR